MNKKNSVVLRPLDNCQVETPPEIISFVWKILKKYRKNSGNVIDFGAGDGRFSIDGSYNKYTGIEIDEDKKTINHFSKKAELKYGCMLDVHDLYDLSIGNPPYYRHHDINRAWRKKAIEVISNETLTPINELCNLFVYFIWMSILRTKEDGIISLIIPYEWVSRPSVKHLRDYVKKNKWAVDVYRFEDVDNIFPDVLTTASLTIINKSVSDGRWNYYNVDKDLNITSRKGQTDTGKEVLPYIVGGEIKAQRGFSPGSQKIFVLTEGIRVRHGIGKKDVIPCVTSFRNIPVDVSILNEKNFKKFFIDNKAKCWLLDTEKKVSDTVKAYLDSIPEDGKNTWTCQNRDIWYKYKIPKIPKILFSSGFVRIRPKMMKNSVGAVAVGSVFGIISEKRIPRSNMLLEYLKSYDFEGRVVHHAGSLRKIEVNQMNWVINQYYNKNRENL